MNNSDASRIGVKTGDPVFLAILDNQFKIAVKINESVPQGMAGLFCRFSDVSFIELPGWRRVSKQQSL